VRYKLDNCNKEYNSLNKSVAKLKIVRGAARRALARSAPRRPKRTPPPSSPSARRWTSSARCWRRVAAAPRARRGLRPASLAQAEEKAAEKAVNEALLKLGNLVHDSVRVDNNEDNNPVESSWGEPRQEAGLPNHVDLVSMLDIVDLEKGQEVAGSRGYYLKGVGVLLNMALINYALAFLARRGFTPVQTPFFMRKECMSECAQLEDFDEQCVAGAGGRGRAGA